MIETVSVPVHSSYLKGKNFSETLIRFVPSFFLLIVTNANGIAILFFSK